MSDDFAIKVEDVSKTFKLPHEKTTSIKGAVVNFYKRKRTYETQRALDNISFEIKKGEFFGIVGRNGSGKSTMLKLLAGIYAPTEGQVHVRGKLTPFIELGVGFNPELTGRENVFLNGALLGFNRKEMTAMYNDIVEFAELERFMDQRLKNYSSGMQVRLAFSIAIRARSDILLLDEVLAVGDAAFQQKCYDYFENLKAEQRTVVFVSHDMGAITRFCNRAVYIKDGQLTFNGSPADIADLYRQENIRDNNSDESEQDSELPYGRDYKIDAKILRQNEKETTFEIHYTLNKKTKTYVGLSIIRDGASIAEMTTPLEKPFSSSGSVTYTIPTDAFNGGVYQFAVALFRAKNRELLAFMKHGIQFVIKGSDVRRGAAMKLPDTWQYDHKAGRYAKD